MTGSHAPNAGMRSSRRIFYSEVIGLARCCIRATRARSTAVFTCGASADAARW